MLLVCALSLTANDCVSILTRPEGRVLPAAVGVVVAAYAVSILTRPEGRVLLHIDLLLFSDYRFQSSPDPKAGCYV